MTTTPTTTMTTSPASDAVPADGKCVTVIFNPVSGKGDPEARRAAFQQALAQHGYRCQEMVTTLEQGAAYFAKQALDDGANLIAVSGGDGTVMEVMGALAGTGIPIAILPAGTGNLLSINLGLPKDIPEAIHAALFGEPRALDLARVTFPDAPADEPRCFAILAGAGYDAWIIRDADRDAKNRLGIGAYLWAALKNLRVQPVRVQIRLDGDRHTLRRRAKSVMVANMGRLQGNVTIVPDARPDDGEVDVAILKAETLKDWVRLAVSVLTRRLRADPSVEFYRARQVEVILSYPQPMQFDGEEAGAPQRAFTVEVVPHAVEVMVPRPSPPRHERSRLSGPPGQGGNAVG